MSSGSSWNVNTIGGAGVTSVTLTGTGDVDSGRTATVIAPGIQLVGTTVTFNAGGLTDADSLSISSTASVASNITLPLTATGAGEVSSGAGADSLTGGNGADRFGLTGRVETFTVGTAGVSDTYIVTINGVATGAQTVAAAAGTADDAAHKAAVATQLAAAINATSATSFATASATNAVVTVTYAQYFGTAGSIAVTDNAGGLITAAAVAVTTAGDNAGNDTISGGLGDDFILGGSGADSLTGGNGADTINGGAGADNINLTETVQGVDVVVLSALTDTYNSTTLFASGGSVAAFDKISGVRNGDQIDFAAIGTLADGATVGNALLTALADGISLIRGVYDAVADTFTPGTGSTADDYMVQFGETTGTTNAGVLLINLTGTVTLTYATEVATIGIA